jgi:hypothetical protein
MNVTVTNSNRDEIQIKYVDSIIAHMDFMEIRELLRDYLHGEKNRYSNEDLEDEIRARGCPYLEDIFEAGNYSLEGVAS